jgi:hypothetical protein
VKSEQDDRLNARGFLNQPGERVLEAPEIVGEVANPLLEAIRRLWWRGVDRVCYWIVQIRLSIHDRTRRSETPQPANLSREADHERSPRSPVAVAEVIPTGYIGLDHHGGRRDDRKRAIRTKIARSEELVLVGYFLARCGAGDDRTLPPAALGTTSWEGVYGMFYDRLGG